MAKNSPAIQETWVRSLGWKDHLDMATHSSILAWRIPWTEPGGLQSMGLQRFGHDCATKNTHHEKKWGEQGMGSRASSSLTFRASAPAFSQGGDDYCEERKSLLTLGQL